MRSGTEVVHAGASLNLAVVVLVAGSDVAICDRGF